MALIIKIKYFDDEIERVNKIPIGDWIDLRAANDIILKKGEFALIPLGVAMQLPVGYEAHIVPRSSTFKNYGIIQTNSPGIIDNSYRGDNDQWYMPVYCIKPKYEIPSIAGKVTVIHKNERICQFRIVESQPEIAFVEVESLGNQDRNGIGTTGIK